MSHRGTPSDHFQQPHSVPSRFFLLYRVSSAVAVAFYFLYCSAAATLFITALGRCLEARDKHSGALDEQLAARMDESNIWKERGRAEHNELFCVFVFFK